MGTRTFPVELEINGRVVEIPVEFEEQPDGTWTNVESIDITWPSCGVKMNRDGRSLMAAVDPAGIGPLHSQEAQDAITREITACILGQRRHSNRLDLRVDVAGQVARIGRDFSAMQAEIGRRILEAVRPALAELARRLRDVE